MKIVLLSIAAALLFQAPLCADEIEAKATELMQAAMQESQRGVGVAVSESYAELQDLAPMVQAVVEMFAAAQKRQAEEQKALANLRIERALGRDSVVG